ncbi:MAG: TolC family protein [Candidatus Aminicenantes bacterium]|nr:TolC family protein [Candidatus Aminicenantes bacterium]
MLKAKFTLKHFYILSQIVFLAGCAVHSVHNESYVSEVLSARTGHELKLGEEGRQTSFPEGISLEDGLNEDEAVAIALWNNAQFQADLVQMGYARADLIEAGMLRNPVFSLLFPLGPKQFEATLSLPIDFFWQRPKRIKFAKLNAEQVADNLIQHGLNLIRHVMSAYAELEFARKRAAITAEEANLQREIADIASERYKVGDISGLENTAFRLEASLTWEASVRIARDAELAEERLKNLLGLGLEKIEIQLKSESDSTELNKLPSDLLEAAFAARPDVRAAEIAIEAAGQQIGWERSRIFNLTSVIDANGEGKEGFEMGPGMQLELPVLNQNNGKITRAKAELTQAARQYIAVKQRIASEVKDAQTHYTAAWKALDILKKDVLPAAEKAAANAAEAYEIGAISYLEFLDFKRQLLTSRLRNTEAELDLRKAKINLEYSIGFKPFTE